MPLNPLIPLSGQYPQYGRVVASNRQQKVENQLAQRRLAQDDRQIDLRERTVELGESQARTQARLRNTLAGALELQQIAAQGDDKAVGEWLGRRFTALKAQQEAGEDIDTRETEEAIAAWRRGGAAAVKTEVDQFISLAQQMGYLEAPTAPTPGAGQFTLGDTRFDAQGNRIVTNPESPQNRAPGAKVTMTSPAAIRAARSPQDLLSHPDTMTFLDKNDPDAIAFAEQGGKDISGLNLQTDSAAFALADDAPSIRLFNTQQASTADFVDISGRLRALSVTGGAEVMATPGAITTTLRSVGAQLAGMANLLGGGEVLNGEDVPSGTLINPDLYSIPKEYGLITAAMKANLVPLVYAFSRAQDPRDRVSETQVQQNFNAISAELNASLAGGDPELFIQALSEIERQMLSSLSRAATQYGQTIDKRLFPEGIFESLAPEQGAQGGVEAPVSPEEFQRRLDEAARVIQENEQETSTFRFR